MVKKESYNWNDDILRKVEQRKQALKALVEEKTAAVNGAPEGSLIIQKKKGCCQYYWRRDKKDTNGDYIAKKDEDIARKLAQKAYDKDVLRNAKNELDLLGDYETFLSTHPMEEIYKGYGLERQGLIEPVRYPDMQYAEAWKAVPYESMGFEFSMDTAEYYSGEGIRVRSKSELIIANMLEKNRIPYRYEYPLKLGKKELMRPDFTCLNLRTRKEYIWEHFGMMDNIAYANKNVAKIQEYARNGYVQGKNLIMSFESSQHALSSAVVAQLIGEYLN